MQWRNGRDIQGGQTSESPHGRSVQYVYMHSLHINIFIVCLDSEFCRSPHILGRALSTERDGTAKEANSEPQVIENSQQGTAYSLFR